MAMLQNINIFKLRRKILDYVSIVPHDNEYCRLLKDTKPYIHGQGRNDILYPMVKSFRNDYSFYVNETKTLIGYFTKDIHDFFLKKAFYDNKQNSILSNEEMNYIYDYNNISEGFYEIEEIIDSHDIEIILPTCKEYSSGSIPEHCFYLLNKGHKLDCRMSIYCLFERRMSDKELNKLKLQYPKCYDYLIEEAEYSRV